MKKVDFIERYGEEAWEKKLEQGREYKKAHREEANATTKKYREEHLEEVKAAVKKYQEEHPEKMIAINHERNRKGGRLYDKMLNAKRTGIPGDKNRIRSKHQKQYKPYKDIIAPDSQLHHEWLPDSPEYRGVALVEAKPHRYGIIDVIEILDGEITLLTEEEIRKKQITKGGV